MNWYVYWEIYMKKKRAIFFSNQLITLNKERRWLEDYLEISENEGFIWIFSDT